MIITMQSTIFGWNIHEYSDLGDPVFKTKTTPKPKLPTLEDILGEISFRNLFNTKKNFIDKKGLKTLANEIKWDYCPWKWDIGSKDPYTRNLNIYVVASRFSKEKTPIVPVSLWDAVYWGDEYYVYPKTFLKEVRK